MSHSKFLNRQSLYLRPDPARVVVRPFKPATEPREPQSNGQGPCLSLQVRGEIALRDFQKGILDGGLVARLPERKVGGAHRAPFLYRFARR